MAFPAGWSHKWPIAINADSVISSPVADWPCLVTDAHIPAGAWALMQATGADLRFSLDEAGATELYYDAPRLSVAGESAHLYVAVPSLASTADTTIYGWCGNAEATAPSAAWMQSTYPASIALWAPMQEGSGTTVGDRTANGYDGTIVDATWAQDANGDWYLQFGAGKYVDLPVAAATTAAADGDFSYLMRLTTDAINSLQIIASATNQNGLGDTQTLGELNIRNNADEPASWLCATGSQNGVTFTVQATTAYTIAGTCSGNTQTVFVNGSQAGQNELATPGSAPTTFRIGRPTTNERYFLGDVSSFAVWATAVSADQAALHHLMLSTPATFAAAGELVAVGGKRIIYPWHTPGFNAGFGRL